MACIVQLFGLLNSFYQINRVVQSERSSSSATNHSVVKVKVKSCYNPLRLGTVIVLVSSGIDFVNTPRLYSDRERLPIWPYGLCPREPKVPGLYKKHTATQPVMPEMRLKPLKFA